MLQLLQQCAKEEEFKQKLKMSLIRDLSCFPQYEFATDLFVYCWMNDEVG